MIFSSLTRCNNLPFCKTPIMVQVRVANTSDAEQILEIYSPYVTGSACTFENEVPSVVEFQTRIMKNLEARPWLVCTLDNAVICYVYASGHRERAAYQWCCESSVYTKNDFQGMGIGRELYKVLFQILKIQGYRNIYAGITLPNEASIKLHEKCGFSHFATYENIGYKLGGWKNVGWWRLSVNHYDRKPSPPLAFSEMQTFEFEELFKTAAAHISKKLVY
jgi:L-amino acid N-acyltransferase YncA